VGWLRPPPLSLAVLGLPSNFVARVIELSLNVAFGPLSSVALTQQIASDWSNSRYAGRIAAAQMTRKLSLDRANFSSRTTAQLDGFKPGRRAM
jgi:hypothetical protein